MSKFLSNFLTLNPKQISLRQDSHLSQSVAIVILAYSKQQKLIERANVVK